MKTQEFHKELKAMTMNLSLNDKITLNQSTNPIDKELELQTIFQINILHRLWS